MFTSRFSQSVTTRIASSVRSAINNTASRQLTVRPGSSLLASAIHNYHNHNAAVTGSTTRQQYYSHQANTASSSTSYNNWKHWAIGITGGMLLYDALQERDESLFSAFMPRLAEACGIVAFVSSNKQGEPALQYLLEGLLILQNRGYDSAGVTTVSKEGELVTTKYASKGSTSDSVQLVMQEAPKRHETDTVGIAHTRWATHGGKTDQNAHPHLDQKNRLALVHNGTIENADAIRSELEKTGINFRSQTDTEVIVQLIGHYYDQDTPLLDAVKKALSRLEGTWGICLIAKDHPNQIIAARNGSPLVVGIGKDRMFVASEVTAFSRHCSDFVALKDGEVAVVSADKSVTSLDLSRTEKAPKLDIELSPAPYPHWTIKEIMEQPEAIARALNYGGRFSNDNTGVRLGGLDMNADILLPIRNLVIAACGTSYFASMYGAQLMRHLGVFDTVEPMDASEVYPDSLPAKDGGMLVVSQSGETKDVHRALELAIEAGIPRFSVVNAVGSLIARTTRCGVYLNAGRENAVASTKAFTTQVTAMALIASWFAERHNPEKSRQARAELIDSLHRLPVSMGMTVRTRDQVHKIAEKLLEKQHLFILGKGYGTPIAYEGALKIKEITYIHAEGYGGGALKHGPFALLDKGIPVVMIILDDQHAELMRIAAAQVKARGAYNIVITDKPSLANGIAEDVITIPSNGPLTALLAVVPLQLLAYEISVLRGIDPDKPRHLAKAVTVD